MSETKITDAIIHENSYPSELQVSISIEGIKCFNECPFVLIIQSYLDTCSKLTIYPINKEKITKVHFSGSDISDKAVETLTNTLKNYEIIHTSGLIFKKKQLLYECYLNLNFSEDVKYKDLITSLDKIKPIFKEIKLEEITLIKNNG